ncbi:hypothetical protein UFOVP63_28 [uncultured Caudovirales phage]|uniref:Tail tubular protein B n=1 Tax=uncultured Caudovirales phage TaxID=2100421 RepID=A0A6J5KQP2_9CAUD|nr:hypothetical protein UFOVP63_28 [uncultured Caudovirales phage]
MPLVSSPIPNLVGGISQQPPSLRLPNTCSNLVNAWPSIVSGNQKRPPTQHVASVPLTISGNVGGYLIDRDPTYRYIVLVTNGDLKVIDTTTGALQSVTFPNGKSYLAASSAVDSFRFMTLGDYTFIVNRNIYVTSSTVSEPVSGTRLDPTNMGTVYVTQSIANSYYSVYVNGILKASYLTPDGTTASTAVPDTGVIAGQLRASLAAAGYTCQQDGSTVTIYNLNPTDKLATQAGTGDKSLRAFTTSVQSFTDLPPRCPEGRIVAVAGDPQTSGDDYYVVYQNGVWVECVGWNAAVKLDAATMPHVLIRNSDGTWTFKVHTWNNRVVGTSSSNKIPSFVGYTINDIFLYTNRMGLLSDENVILSESGIYENFFRTTVAQLIDSDRIDVAVLSSGVQVLNHAVPYNRDLLLTSETSQFRLTYTNFLGPKNIQVKFTTAFNVSKRIKPINMGNSIYLADDRPDYSYLKLWEYHPKDLAVSDDADDVTSSVPEFIPNNASFLAGSNRAKVAVVTSATNPTDLFFYKFYWVNDAKVQSSWHKWTFNDCIKIHWGAFSGLYFFALIERSDGLSLEKVEFDEDVFTTNTAYQVYLDRRASPTSMTYNSTTGLTTVTLPWSTSSTVEVVSTDTINGIYGYRNDVTRVNSTTVTVAADITAQAVTVGLPYTWLHEFTQLFIRSPKRTSQTSEYVVLDGRIQVRYLTVAYHNTAYFQVHVLQPGRDEYVTDFNGRIVGGDSAVLGQQSFASGKFRIPVMADSYKVRVWLTNDSPFPSAFGNAEYQAFVSQKSAMRV